jgi:hypothetical protein
MSIVTPPRLTPGAVPHHNPLIIFHLPYPSNWGFSHCSVRPNGHLAGSPEQRGAGELGWGDQIDLCPDALYLKVTGKTPEDLFPALRHVPTRA